MVTRVEVWENKKSRGNTAYYFEFSQTFTSSNKSVFYSCIKLTLGKLSMFPQSYGKWLSTNTVVINVPNRKSHLLQDVGSRRKWNLRLFREFFLFLLSCSLERLTEHFQCNTSVHVDSLGYFPQVNLGIN